MAEIKVKYRELENIRDSIEGKILVLIEYVEDLDKSIKKLATNWQGNISDKVQEKSVELSEYTNNNIMDFKKTKEYIKVAERIYKESEESSASQYKEEK